MDSGVSRDSTWIPHGFLKLSFHVDSGVSRESAWIPHGFHVESIVLFPRKMEFQNPSGMHGFHKECVGEGNELDN